MRSVSVLLSIILGLAFLSGCGSEDELAVNEETSVVEESMTDAILSQMVPIESVTAGEAAAEDAEIAAQPQAEPIAEISADGISASSVSADSVSDDETDEANEILDEQPDQKEDIADDSDGTFTSEHIPDAVFARMSGVSYPADCTIAREDLRYLRLSYYDFNGQSQVGEMVCNKKIADDLVSIFKELYARGYQIEKMKLIDDYGGDDDLSCAENNTSCFNYRTVAGSTNLSKHALGLAIDINPFYNPYVTYPNGVERISPPGSEPYADRSADFPHKIGPGDATYELFKSHGFTWGGNWKTLKDYQHFQKAE